MLSEFLAEEVLWEGKLPGELDTLFQDDMGNTDDDQNELNAFLEQIRGYATSAEVSKYEGGDSIKM